MLERRILKFRPHFERLEEKRPLSGGAASATATSAGAGTSANPEVSAEATEVKPNYGYLVYRITNPDQYNNSLTPPFTQVLVQTKQPVAGQTYNVLYVAVRNGTAQTFNSTSNFYVRFPGDPTKFPILTGTQTWKPGQEFVFYVLTKSYYPLPSEVHSGFEFSLKGARSIGIPGPSGIYLRVKYNPLRFDKTLNWIVAYGPGAQGGTGIKYGLPDTAIYEFVSSQTNRNDFSGYF
jgi:hypothetical protein